MVKLLTHAGRCTGRYMALAALTTTLAACGGGSGDTTDETTGLDFPDATDTDRDGDGIEDVDDLFVDLDGDGFDDLDGEQDLDNDGTINRLDSDADNDGLNDLALLPDGTREDTFIDLNGDGLDDETLLPDDSNNFAGITPATPCGSEAGSDARSENDAWNDNCLIRRSDQVGQGQFADSLYAAGIQRVVFCSGFGGNAGDTSYAAFADGEYGPASEAALELFQASEPGRLNPDGQVGPDTWGKLQDALVRLSLGEVGSDANGNATVGPDVYGVAGARCEDIPLFYQELTIGADGATFIPGGWSLVKNAPSLESVPFSIDPPFNRLD